jgi:hypothetical protein
VWTPTTATTPVVQPPSGLTYAVSPAVYTVGTAIPVNTPNASGSAVASYSVSPVLPAGLNLDPSTGVISGTPLAATATATYTATASNSAGSATAGVSITVNAAVVSPSGLTYSVNPANYAVGTAIPANTPSSGGGAVTAYTVAPALPGGLILDPSTGVISGTPTVATATMTCTVTAANSAGRSSVDVQITVQPAVVPPSSLTYATNPANYPVGTAIVPNTPACSGGAVTLFSVSPVLPAGLSMNSSTGVISGTPTLVAAMATYTVTAINAAGSTTAALNLSTETLPVANAGSTQHVGIVSTVTLNGTLSHDPEGQPLTYAWTLTAVPSGSQARLSSATQVSPSFVADIAGTYQATLIVSNGTNASLPSTVSIVCVSDLSFLFQAQAAQSVITFNNVLQAGSQFSLQITNNSTNGTFQLNMFTLNNGSTMVASTINPANLNNGYLAPGQSVALTVTLGVAEIINGTIEASYFLFDPNSNTSFTVSTVYIVD